jgi:hypothetical protein
MTGHGDKLSRKQEQALTALLLCPSITEAAAQCEVADVTLRRWLKQAGFQAAYLAARREVVKQALTQVQQACGLAVTTLTAVMQDGESPASAKVSAAKAILETAVKAVELEDLEARITALEAQGAPSR